MTANRYRIDSSDFRRTPSRETLKHNFLDFFDFLKVTSDTSAQNGPLQIDLRCSLDAPWVLLDPLKININYKL